MAEHYTRSTTEASLWCSRCYKHTFHRIDSGRKGPCLNCITKREEEIAERKAREGKKPVQGDFWLPPAA